MSHQTVSIPELVERIHRSGKHLAMVITGGGAAAISWLLTQPGASRSILEIVVPYHDQALCEYLGHRPEQFCSLATSRALAMVGFFRARRIAGQVTNCIGLACTASLVTDRPKRGDHRVHVAYQGETTAGSSSLVLQKGARDRSAEDELAARLVLWELAEACGLEARPALPILPGEDPQMSRVEAPTSWSAVLLGNTPFTFARGEPAAPDLTKLAILPGSFNPFHEGHRRMIQVASRHLGRPVVLELSVINADKPPVDYCSLADRLAGIPAEIPVILSQAPTFAEKARLFPGCVFLVGIDTLLRIADPRFYGGSVAARDRAIKEIAEAGCRFLVFGRLIEGEFRELDSAGVPEFLRSLCQGISETEFRMDISSTELRRGRGGPSQPETPN